MYLMPQSFEILYPNLEEFGEPKRLVKLIEQAGRVCYQSESKGYPEDFVRKIVRSGHHSVIEHVNFTVCFVTDRGVTHELVRHRLASYSQESTRYCRYKHGLSIIRPVHLEQVLPLGEYSMGPDGHVLYEGSALRTDLTASCWVGGMLAAEKNYLMLLDEGWSPQEARSVLPNSLKTEIIMTANIREWRHIFSLRCTQAAHPQIRALLEPLQARFQEALPSLFKV